MASQTLETSINLDSGSPHFIRQYSDAFKKLGADEKLAALWYVYDGIEEHSIEKPDQNRASDSSMELYKTIQSKSEDEQLQFMRDVLSGSNNDLMRSYNELNDTTKIALWYRLGHGMAEGSVIEVPSDYNLSDEAKVLVDKLNKISFEERYVFMRDALLGMSDA